LELKKKKLLVTGGSGFIGSHLVDELLKKGNEVIVYDNLDDFYPYKQHNFSHNLKNKNFYFVNGDILNYEQLITSMKGVDVVFHGAAQPGIRYCNLNPLKAHNVNTFGTFNVLSAARYFNIKKVLYASSSSIFGDPVYLPIDEKHPTDPNSPYGATKLAAEKYCLAFNRVYDLNISSLRYFSVYGPRGRPDQAVYKFVENVTKGLPPIIFGDGTNTRDFTYVSDVVEATILAAESEINTWEIYNIGYGSEQSINEITKKIISLLKKEESINIRYEKSYKGDFSKTLVNNSKAQKYLGWKPKVSFDKGLNHFIQWFNKNKKKKIT
jgi:UDP-glucose 4-epimerase